MRGARRFLLGILGALLIALCVPQAALPQVPGMFNPLRAGAALGPVAITYQTTASDTSAQTTYTFTSQATGTAASDRVVIAAAWTRDASNSGSTITGLTICGNPATAIKTQAGIGTGNGPMGIFALLVPTGTTCTITFTMSAGSANRGAIAVWSMRGTGGLTASSATASATSGSPTISTTLTIPASGGAVAIAGDYSTGALTSTWSGLTKDFDTQPTTNAFSGSHQNYTTLQSGLTISDTFSGATTAPLLIAAAWAPG